MVQRLLLNLTNHTETLWVYTRVLDIIGKYLYDIWSIFVKLWLSMILNLCSRFRHKLFDNPLLFYCVFCRNANIALQTGTASVGPQVQGRNQTNNETLSNGNNKRAHETVDIMEIEKQDFPAGLTTYLNIYLT